MACTFPRCDSTSDQLGTFLCCIFAVFDPRSAVPWYLASVGTILDLLLHIYFLYSQPQTQKYREEFPGLRSQWGSVQPIPCILQHSTLACIFSNSRIIYSKQRRTILQSLAWHGSVRDPLRCQIPSSWSGSPVALLSMPHLCTALAINERRVPKPGGHLYEVTHCAETCATGSNTSYSLNLRQTWVIWAVPPSIPHSCAALETQAENVSDCADHSYEITWHMEACTTASNVPNHLTQQGLCSPLFPFPNSPHLCTALGIRLTHLQLGWPYIRHLVLHGGLHNPSYTVSPQSICPPLVYPTHVFRSRDRLCKLDQSRCSFSQNVHISSKRKKTFIC